MYAIENWLIGKKGQFPAYLASERDYFEDMEAVLHELYRVCKTGAWVGIVVGNAYFPQEDRIVESDLVLSDLAEKAGFQVKEILVLQKRFALQRRTLQRGELRESLIIAEK